ncbi:hypothetical protein C8J48_3010 [Desmospora activa DSM 45169]|uniref:Uncharacterized protein n=1 Tax=Desmospora activa DSM 45169 TaxID=1121389 RepID=A0A2T4Z497_9BACL|nr:hypothetical protein C8J48_3010 [Desmospora activa DSM 45169]
MEGIFESEILFRATQRKPPRVGKSDALLSDSEFFLAPNLCD